MDKFDETLEGSPSFIHVIVVLKQSMFTVCRPVLYFSTMVTRQFEKCTFKLRPIGSRRILSNINTRVETRLEHLSIDITLEKTLNTCAENWDEYSSKYYYEGNLNIF